MNQLVRIVALVRNHGLRFVLAQQFFRSRHIVFLSRAEAEFQRLALGIYCQVQLATESATAAAERFIRRVFFWEPAAC